MLGCSFMRYLVFGFHTFGYPLGVITCIDLNNIIINCGHIINFFPPFLAWKILALSHFCSMDLAVLGPIPLANILVNIHAVKLYDCTLFSPSPGTIILLMYFPRHHGNLTYLTHWALTDIGRWKYFVKCTYQGAYWNRGTYYKNSSK